MKKPPARPAIQKTITKTVTVETSVAISRDELDKIIIAHLGLPEGATVEFCVTYDYLNDNPACIVTHRTITESVE